MSKSAGKMLSNFAPLQDVENIWTAETTSLRVTALVLNDGAICIYSPVSGLSPDTLTSLKKLGEVKYLFAPNHYHNKGLAEYRQAFPKAKLICSPKALSRLEKQTGLVFETLEALEQSLASNMTMIEPDGLKTGETWVNVESETHKVWVVTDAFRGKGKSNAVTTNNVELLGTFPKFGIGDLSQYAKWLTMQIKQGRPDVIVPCHGAVASGPDIASQALLLVQALEN